MVGPWKGHGVCLNIWNTCLSLRTYSRLSRCKDNKTGLKTSWKRLPRWDFLNGSLLKLFFPFGLLKREKQRVILEGFLNFSLVFPDDFKGKNGEKNNQWGFKVISRVKYTKTAILRWRKSRTCQLTTSCRNSCLSKSNRKSRCSLLKKVRYF